MSKPTTWTCPGCGATIRLPADMVGSQGPLAERRLDQLAQALCGCYVLFMSEASLERLWGAVLDGAARRRRGGNPRRTSAGSAV